jgi:subtilisin family serine protease
VALGPGIGNPNPCVDNQFHGTHVAGIVAAQANGLGVVGVAPNVTLVPVKVCDAPGYCYSSATVAGITYAGDAKLDVINMSFFVDDDEFLESTEFKCLSDPQQRAFRRANERALQYARDRGVAPVAALGNSDNDLANPPEPYTNECEVVPAESPGVVGTVALSDRRARRRPTRTTATVRRTSRRRAETARPATAPRPCSRRFPAAGAASRGRRWPLPTPQGSPL